jgi:hypothetical protein
MAEVVCIRIAGDRAREFKKVVEAFPGLTANTAGEAAASLFIELREQEPERVAAVIRRVQAGRIELRLARRAARRLGGAQ